MSEIKKLRKQFNQKFNDLVLEIQNNCPHNNLDPWEDDPDNILQEIKRCHRCDKIINTREKEL